MKRFQKLIAVILTVLILSTAAVTAMATEEDSFSDVTFTEVNEIVYTLTSVNVRVGPGLDYDIIATVNYGNAIRRIGLGSNGWSKVMYRSQEAYMYTGLLTTKKPSGSGGTIDDGELKRQIAIANGLNQADYSKESWEVLILALETAETAMDSGSQLLADEAVQSLKDGIAGLVKMDYSVLERTLLDVDTFVQADQSNALWDEFLETVNHGRALLTSGDQAAVDAAAQQISQLFAQIQESVAQLQTPEVVVQEVPVEVPPTDDYCNIPAHHTWPVLFFISLAINMVLGAMIGVYVYKKKKTRNDDTPLVDYDIVDDTF